MQMFALSGPIKNAASDSEASFYLYGQAAALTKEAAAGEIIGMLVEETSLALTKPRA